MRRSLLFILFFRLWFNSRRYGLFEGPAVKPQGHEGTQRHTDGTVNNRNNTEH